MTVKVLQVQVLSSAPLLPDDPKAPAVTGTSFPISRVLAAVRRANRPHEAPSVTRIAVERDPFLVLVATILSLRTKDSTTRAAASRLFAFARTPEALARAPVARIERAIYPVGFYRTKARRLRLLARSLIERFDGKVPADLETLLSLDGVGRKTANLVVTLGHGLPGICVDVHVHRIVNRWGYLRTRDPHETEARLRRILPRRHWMEINDLLVTFGQTVCRPVSPWCSRCPVRRRCGRIGVKKAR